MTRTILLTGPVRAFDRWRAPLEAAGWHVETLALVETVPVAFERDDADVPDWVLFTSAAAVEAFGPPAALARVPCGVVGRATRNAALDAGWAVQLVGRSTARELARKLFGAASPRRVLWPRGDLAEELGERLVARGVEVHSPVVYATCPAEVETPPVADVVFFASPSAVRAWNLDWPQPRAIAIGPTTAAALVDAGWRNALQLEEPAPGALVAALDESHP